jgi:hypothetical protein
MILGKRISTWEWLYYIHYISWLAIYVGIEVIAFVSTANLLVRGA